METAHKEVDNRQRGQRQQRRRRAGILGAGPVIARALTLVVLAGVMPSLPGDKPLVDAKPLGDWWLTYSDARAVAWTCPGLMRASCVLVRTQLRGRSHLALLRVLDVHLQTGRLRPAARASGRLTPTPPSGLAPVLAMWAFVYRTTTVCSKPYDIDVVDLTSTVLDMCGSNDAALNGIGSSPAAWFSGGGMLHGTGYRDQLNLRNNDNGSYGNQVNARTDPSPGESALFDAICAMIFAPAYLFLGHL